MKSRKSLIISIIIVILIVLGGGIFYYFNYYKKSKIAPMSTSKPEIGPIIQSEHESCLAEDEVVDYTINTKYIKELRIPTVPVTILIKDKISGQVLHTFGIDNFLPLLRIHKCGIYVTREYNKDQPNYRTELWRYDYTGKGFYLFTLSEFKAGKPIGATYGSAPLIDPREELLALERGYLGQPDYALVIKNLKTLDDVFTFTFSDIKKINPDIVLGNFSIGVPLGNLEIGRWTNDNRYLWGTLFVGNLDTAYYCIEAHSWKTEVFSPPPDMPGGSEQAVSFNGYLAYADFPTFFGMDIIAQQEQERFKQEGKVKHLYLYNLRTKEKTLLATTTDPAQRFNIKWLSDTELEYQLPSGEKKVYKIENE